jgi:hypothetical protein
MEKFLHFACTVRGIEHVCPDPRLDAPKLCLTRIGILIDRLNSRFGEVLAAILMR